MWSFLYRAAWTLGAPLVALAAPGDGKVGRALRGRRGSAQALRRWAALHRDTSRPLIWFHAASVGEGRQAEAVLRRLRSARPGWQIAYTHTSPSAERLAAGMPADVADYLPADTRRDTAAALDALQPSALIFAATDLWPELVAQARLRKVPLGLVSATLAPTSSRRGRLARALLGGSYRALDAVGAIDPRDADELVRLGVRSDRITVTGDTRHDAAAARLARSALDELPELGALRAPGPPIVVAGSTWASDEDELLGAVAAVRGRHPMRLVIAPHEPSARHLEALERRIATVLPGLAASRLSGLSGPGGAWDACVVDRLGLLADLYRIAAVAYVGGGFHDAGLHSVIEPAAARVPVLFGPRWRSSRDAGLLLDAGGAATAGGRDELASLLAHWLGDEGARVAAGATARSVVDRGLGAADRSLDLVLRLVEAAPKVP